MEIEYDIINNLWEELANFPDIGRNHPAMILVNDKIYMGLGSVDGENLGDWWEYNITQNTWTEKANFEFGDRHHPFYFSINDFASALLIPSSLPVNIKVKSFNIPDDDLCFSGIISNIFLKNLEKMRRLINSQLGF